MYQLSLASLSWKNVTPHHAQEVYKLGTILIVPHKKGTLLKMFTTNVHGQTDLLNLLKQGETQTHQNYSEMDNVNPALQLALPVPNDH